MLFGKPNADPNATAAKNALPGTVPGSTPPVLLAATRGYFKVIIIQVEKTMVNNNVSIVFMILLVFRTFSIIR